MLLLWHEQVEGVEQLVSGEGPRGFGLPAMLQQYVEHGGCLFKVSPCFECTAVKEQQVKNSCKRQLAHKSSSPKTL
jgi:hypothetical protein